jgi:ubiquinone/menaquinone biosynthesis C-methylase UbiE
MRLQVHNHVETFLKPNSNILELNAGTGIDALHFASKGHHVHATDLSDGMIETLARKVSKNNLHEALSVQQVSFESLEKIQKGKFDYIFSNFGGLNCISDLSQVTGHFPRLINEGAFITLVVMPVVCPWEIAGSFRHGLKAFRRFGKGGVTAHLEGEYFKTYYHSLTAVKNAFDDRFRIVRTEGLAALTPPPHRFDFPKTHPALDQFLLKADRLLRNHFPFNRWADHLIVTFQYQA